MPPTKTQIASISRLFSPGVITELAREGRSALFARLYPDTGLANENDSDQATVGAAYESAFAVLRKSGLRDEYVYKAALTHNILLGQHSLRTASMLTEFRAGECKADIVILNGTASVYEIKSERDTLSRLAKQIQNYQKVFARVYVIAGHVHVDDVLHAVPEEVGVLSLIRWNRIRTVREATEAFDLISPVTLFDSLRASEAEQILKNFNVPVPEVPNIQFRNAMRELFMGLPAEGLHKEMVSVLNQSRNLEALSDLVKTVPKSLRPAVLSLQIPKVGHHNLISAIQTPLTEAMQWG